MFLLRIIPRESFAGTFSALDVWPTPVRVCVFLNYGRKHGQPRGNPCKQSKGRIPTTRTRVTTAPRSTKGIHWELCQTQVPMIKSPRTCQISQVKQGLSLDSASMGEHCERGAVIMFELIEVSTHKQKSQWVSGSKQHVVRFISCLQPWANRGNSTFLWQRWVYPQVPHTEIQYLIGLKEMKDRVDR